MSAVPSGTVVTLTATVMSGGAALVTPGLVRFCDSRLNAFCLGNALLGTAEITPEGAAAIKMRLGLGTHSLTAVYAGTLSYAKSTSTAVPLLVQGLAASVTTMTVTPTGAAGGYELSTAVASMGAGALAWPPTGPVTFVYAGDASYLGSTSPIVPVTINPSTRPAVISWSSPEPAPAGTALTEKQLNATADLEGTMVYSPPTGTVLGKGEHGLTAEFKPSPAAARKGYLATKKSVMLMVE